MGLGKQKYAGCQFRGLSLWEKMHNERPQILFHVAPLLLFASQKLNVFHVANGFWCNFFYPAELYPAELFLDRELGSSLFFNVASAPFSLRRSTKDCYNVQA